MAEPALASAVRGVHAAFLYQSMDEFLTGVAGFVSAALEEGGRVLAAVPGPRGGALRDHVGELAHRVWWADFTLVSGNPARIMPAIRGFAGSLGGRPYCVHEPVWEGRSTAERREALRHEALLNLAFTGESVTIMCPYDTAHLEPDVIETAKRIHPVVIRDGRAGPSPAFDTAVVVPEECEQPLEPPPGGADTLAYQADLASVRAFTSSLARESGLAPDRARDVMIAVSELAANTLRHAGGHGTLTIWTADGELLCQVEDAGYITDPLVGRQAPAPDGLGGHGLWVVHQLCDLVEIRTSMAGTVIRLHMRLPG
jgi:anti-sigma regulatory factor (Ser/Thr protein kinase)